MSSFHRLTETSNFILKLFPIGILTLFFFSSEKLKKEIISYNQRLNSRDTSLMFYRLPSDLCCPCTICQEDMVTPRQRGFII